MVVKGLVAGVMRGWMYEGLDSFQIDQNGIVESKTTLVNRASPGTPLTVTVVPANCGQKFGIDRDGDGYGEPYGVLSSSSYGRFVACPRENSLRDYQRHSHCP